jgi:hypothetical protein
MNGQSGQESGRECVGYVLGKIDCLRLSFRLAFAGVNKTCEGGCRSRNALKTAIEMEARVSGRDPDLATEGV